MLLKQYITDINEIDKGPKMTKIYWLLLLNMIILAGCGTVYVTPSSVPSSTDEISTISATSRIQITPSEVIMPSTKMPISTATIPSTTPTIFLTPTPTFFPTVSDDQSEMVLTKLLQTNGACLDKQPCFWGFTPFVSNADQTRNYLLSLGRRAGEYAFYFTVKEKIRISLDYDAQNGYLGNLNVQLSGMDWPVITNKDWEAYNIDSIIKNYGKPDDIKITGGALEGGNHFFLYYKIYYYKIGLSIGYTSKVLTDLSYTCPLEERWTNSIEWTYGNGNTNPQGLVDVNEALGMSIDDFVNLIQTKHAEACFKVNTKSLLP